MFKVAVQLLSWNGEKHLRACLESLAKQTYVDFELLVLDSGSTDNSVLVIEDVLKTFPRPARLIKLEKNLGFSGGHNRLFGVVDAPYVFCVNQDVVLDNDYLKEIIKTFDADKRLAAASGVLRHDDGKIDTAGLAKNWYEKIFDITKEPSIPITRVFGVSGALPVYRRAAVLEVSPDGKLFDESFFSYKEDVDLAWRLNIFNWHACVVSGARAIHERGFGSDKKWDAARFVRQKLSSRNHLLTLVKDLSPREFWLLPVIVFYELGKTVYLAIFVPNALGFILEFFKILPNALKARKVIWSRLRAAR